ncbi:MAG: IS1380 family transposase [Verrucomicrobiales bacterium]|nr:IS1380 family transposase [Verrucomicrobiales bacterium]
MTDCIQQTFAFQDLAGRKVEADFKGGNVSADGGVLLLREIDLRTGMIAQLAACFTDYRRPELIEHTVPELLRQRILAMAMGYEDLNDHDTLRRDPMMAIGVGKPEPLGLDRSGIDRGRALAGKSTLNRLELTNAKTGSGTVGGVHKTHADHSAIERLLVRMAVSRLAPDTEEIVLDFDATDSLIHGEQEGRFFHGYYDAYCYLPLYCFIGPWPVWAQLRTSNRDACEGTVEALEKIVPIIRERFPEARVILRADSGFARDEIFSWCEANNLFYVTGMAKNAALLRHLDPTMFRAKADACMRGGWCTHFCEFEYRTAKSWSRARRVIGKAQVNPKGENPRFIVTNLPEDHALRESRRLYREFYCARGDMENRIKEQQLDLFADRMSCAEMSSNQLRLWFSTFTYVWMIDLRETGLKQSKAYATATPATIRERLLKIAAVVTVSVRRVVVRWSSSFRFQAEVAACWERMRAAPA